MYFYSDKTIFEGQWRNDKKGKYGVVRYANGCEFKGEWISEEKQLGVIKYKNGEEVCYIAWSWISPYVGGKVI